MWKKIRKTLSEWFQMIVLSVVVAILINLFVFQPVRIEGESMIPTLQNEDYVILSKLGRTFNMDLKYGDIVVIDRSGEKSRSIFDEIQKTGIFNNKVDEKKLIIKRIIGLEGDKVDIRDGRVYRNGILLDEPYLLDEIMLEPNDSYLVPPGHVFVLGDNRNNSLDSRLIGYIPIESIQGTMVLDISELLR
ncbi:MAG: signal peptidase I [Clostridiales bacterium]|nr:signal peptidase I [Clostridiales bacterium]